MARGGVLLVALGLVASACTSDTLPGATDSTDATSPASDQQSLPTPGEIVADNVVTDEERELASQAVLQCVADKGMDVSLARYEAHYLVQGNYREEFTGCWQPYMGLSAGFPWADHLALPVGEYYFYKVIVECTEARTGKVFGPMTQADTVGLLSSEAQRTIDKAFSEERDTYLECFGEHIDPAGRALLDVPEAQPIIGYGDFSDTPYGELDWFEVVTLMVQCANDEGMPVRVAPLGDGIEFGRVSIDQHAIAAAIVDACEAGLNLPPYEDLTDEQLKDLYDELIEVNRCLEDEGYTVSEPPSLETFITTYETWGWHPYDSLLEDDPNLWGRLMTLCPQP